MNISFNVSLIRKQWDVFRIGQQKRWRIMHQCTILLIKQDCPSPSAVADHSIYSENVDKQLKSR